MAWLNLLQRATPATAPACILTRESLAPAVRLCEVLFIIPISM
jgi:hypothetical protein